MNKKIPVSVNTFVASIYIGGRIGYNGPYFTQTELEKAISDFQKMQTDFCSVTITKNMFVAGDYTEEGFCIGMINYPRFPKNDYEIRNFAFNLTDHLLTQFQQNRMSIVFPDATFMIESENAEEHPK